MTTQPGHAQPLWSNEDIHDRAGDIAKKYGMPNGLRLSIEIILLAMRDDWHNERATLTAQLAELLEWQATATRDLKMVIDANHNQQRVIQNERANSDKLRGRITELEAQLAQAQAGRWEPITDIKITNHIMLSENGVQVGVWTGYTYAFGDLPDNIRLCRWQEGSE